MKSPVLPAQRRGAPRPPAAAAPRPRRWRCDARRASPRGLLPPTRRIADASLRLLDWFVINYSRRHKLHLEGTNIYQSYRNWRRFWRQDQFDVCRRGTRIHFERQGEVYTTTVAQMNYMYWAHQHGVRAYVDAHKLEIAHDMSQRIRRLAKQGVKRKRLVVPSGLACTVISEPSEVHF